MDKDSKIYFFYKNILDKNQYKLSREALEEVYLVYSNKVLFAVNPEALTNIKDSNAYDKSKKEWLVEQIVDNKIIESVSCIVGSQQTYYGMQMSDCKITFDTQQKNGYRIISEILTYTIVSNGSQRSDYQGAVSISVDGISRGGMDGSVIDLKLLATTKGKVRVKFFSALPNFSFGWTIGDLKVETVYEPIMAKFDRLNFASLSDVSPVEKLKQAYHKEMGIVEPVQDSSEKTGISPLPLGGVRGGAEQTTEPVKTSPAPISMITSSQPLALVIVRPSVIIPPVVIPVVPKVPVPVAPSVVAPKISTFTTSPLKIDEGKSATLSWTLAGGTPTTLLLWTLINGRYANPVSVMGTTSKVLSPKETTSYALTAINSAGRADSFVKILSSASAPKISFFSASNTSLVKGQSTYLDWTLTEGTPTSLSIDNGIGSVLGKNFILVSPQVNTFYTLTASNKWGTVTSKIVVGVRDIIRPVIILNGANPQIIELGNAYSELGATVTNNSNGGIKLTILSSKVNTNAVGTYEVTYVTQNVRAGIVTPVTRTVKVVDTTKPVIKLTGVSSQIIELGSTYTELGATVTDNQKDPITAIIDSSAIKINEVGNYLVTYTAKDNAGNFAIPITRTVKVILSAPIISDFSTNSLNIMEGESTNLSWTLTGGAPTTLSITNSVNQSSVNSVIGATTLPISPSITTTYTLTATNATAEVKKSITVIVNLNTLTAQADEFSPTPNPSQKEGGNPVSTSTTTIKDIHSEISETYTKYYPSPYYEYDSRGTVTINVPFNGKVVATMKYNRDKIYDLGFKNPESEILIPKSYFINPEVSYLHLNYLGSPVIITNEGGTIVQTLKRDAWGNVLPATHPLDPLDKLGASNQSPATRIGFTGHKYDLDSELTYAHARYLSTANKVFLSQDPEFWEGFTNDRFLLNPQSQNSYAYANNNPVNFTDPTGRYSWNQFKQDVVNVGNNLLPGPKERYNSIADSIKQRSLDPLKYSLSRQTQEMFPQNSDGRDVALGKMTNVIMGFVGGGKPVGGAIKGALARPSSTKIPAISIESLPSEAQKLLGEYKSNGWQKVTSGETKTPHIFRNKGNPLPDKGTIFDAQYKASQGQNTNRFIKINDDLYFTNNHYDAPWAKNGEPPFYKIIDE